MNRIVIAVALFLTALATGAEAQPKPANCPAGFHSVCQLTGNTWYCLCAGN